MSTPDAKIRLWARTSPDAELSLESVGAAAALPGEPKAGGMLFRIEVTRASTFEVVAKRSGATARFTLSIERQDRPEYLAEAHSIARAGQLEQARALLERHLVDPAAERRRGAILALLARVELRAGEPQRARELVREAIENHRQWSDLSKEISDRCLLVRLEYYDLGDFRAAIEALEQVPSPPPGDADSAYYVAFYRGTLAFYTGDARVALRHLVSAREQRQRLADAQGWWDSTLMLALLLRRLGRASEARVLYDELTSEQQLLSQLDACQRARLFNNVAWDRLLALEAGLEADDPLPLLDQALDELDAGPRCQPIERVGVELNKALAYLHGANLEAAAHHLELARRDLGSASPRLLLWQLDIEARLDHERGHLELAERGFRTLRDKAIDAISLEAEWRALFGLARVAEAAGQPGKALEAYARAEDVLDDFSLNSPIGLGRATSTIAGEPATRRYLTLLLEQGRDDEALRVARQSRSRILRGLMLEERIARLDSDEAAKWGELLSSYNQQAAALDVALAEDWQVPGQHRRNVEFKRQEQRRELNRLLDQAHELLDLGGLASAMQPLVPGPGEAVLVYHPTSQGWVGFALDEAGMTVARLGELSRDQPPEELATRLLGPFRERLAKVSKLRVLSYGWLREIDFHSLRIDGDRLLTRTAVVDSLDLPSGARREAALSRQALVIADPTETLPAVGHEALTVAARLLEAGLEVDMLSGEEATRQTVLAGLGSARLLHFAGHADFGGGLDGALRLAAASRLSIGDVLAASAVPNSVVLAACDSGRTPREAPGPSLGLAQAFLIAGSREVLATTRAVDDHAAATLVAALYRHWDGIGPLAEALRQARLELQARPGMDLAAFRVLER